MSFSEQLRDRADRDRAAAQSALAAADDLGSAAAAIDAAAAAIADHTRRIADLVSLLSAMTAERDALQAIIDAGTVPPPQPTYTLTSSHTQIDEGADVTITLRTTGLPDGALVPYSISGVDRSDIVGELTGTFSIGADGTAQATIAVRADLLTEGSETITLSLAGDLAHVSVVVFDTSRTPVVEPPPVVNPGDHIRYRSDYPLLFSAVAAAVEPSRVPGGAPLRLDTVGPTGTMVGGNAGPWDRYGGDWIDADGVRYGSKPWASVPINAVKGATASADYSVDCTALVLESQKPGRYLAMLLSRTGGQRKIAGAFGSTPPVMLVTLADNTVERIPCHVTAAIVNTSLPETTLTEMSLPIFIEFEKPTGPVVSAVMLFHITQHWDGNATLSLFLLDPPRNTNPVQQGIAVEAALDAGLPGRPDVIHVHRYVDGAPISDFVFSEKLGGAGYNFSAENAYDPAIYETGPQDLTRFPHAGLGKWVGAPTSLATTDVNGIRVQALWTKVDSGYRDEGFEPLAPGMGAIRMLMRRGYDLTTGAPITDGSFGGYGGTNGGAARLFMPESRFGLQKRVFVRQYIRIGTADGGPMGGANLHQVYKDRPPAVAVWSNAAGKCFAAPSHDTTFGGFSGTAGGFYGTNFRLGWHQGYRIVRGADVGGWGFGPHMMADYQAAQPAGYNYGNWARGDQTFGQIGGKGGMLYAHRWYCLETEIDLNSVRDTYPGFSPDGVYRQWLDGVLVYEKSGLVWRQNPAYSGWRTMLHNSGHGVDQFAQARVSGMQSGKGYAGVTVRHNGARNGPGYTAFVSRSGVNRAVVVLVKRSTMRLGEELAMTAELEWFDGDVLRLEAVGVGPTTLTVKRGDEILLTHVDVLDTAHRGRRIGAFGASNESAADGLWLTDWRGGSDTVALDDGFAYPDGPLSPPWTSVDQIGFGRVDGGRLWFPRAGSSLTFDRQLACRPIREIGHREILFNWFHGGLTQNDEDRVIFLSGLVVSDTYVGPMRGIL